MKIDLPQNVNFIINKLYANGFEAFAVGGCVRDSLLGRQPQDWDITTSAKPYEVKEIFGHTIDTGIQHGTVTVMIDHVGYEVTTYRIDGEYEDARHPKEVTFTSNLKLDLQRRDFTINAMAYNHKTGIVDEFDGISDLQNGIIRCVGCAHDRFSEDALRMFRAVRFAAQLDFEIESETAAAIKELAPTLKKVSAERIQTELVKLVVSDHPEKMRTLYELGLTKVFMPEFDEMMQTEQVNKHHIYTVGEHTIAAMQHVRADKVLRLSMLFHDVAKPVCITTDEEGQNHFKGHPQVGEEMTKKIMRRLKFDNKTTSACCCLVREHDERPQITQRNVRRAMSRIGTELFPLLFEVKNADTLAQSMYHRQEKLDYVKQYKQTYEQILAEKQCVRKSDMVISGRDLMELGIEQGPILGKVIDGLYEEILDDPTLNTKEKLKELAIEYGKKLKCFVGIFLLLFCVTIQMTACKNSEELTGTRYFYNSMNDDSSEKLEESSTTEFESDLYIVENVNSTNETIRAYKYTNGLEYQFHYSLFTEFLNQYADHVSVSGINQGDAIVISGTDTEGKIKKVQKSSIVWTNSDVSNFDIDEENGIFTIGKTNYKTDASTLIFSGDGLAQFSDITSNDRLSVVGIDKRIVSVSVVTGHGTIKLENTSLFEGSYLQLDDSIFAEITADMELEVPEGEYTLAVANNGWGGSTQIAVKRGEQTVVNLDDLKGEGPKISSILFEVDVEGARIYIDGEEIDYSNIVEVTYGEHTLSVIADGYDKWTKTLYVNSKEATISIALEDEDDTDGTDDASNSDTSSNTTDNDNSDDNESNNGSNSDSNNSGNSSSSSGASSNGNTGSSSSSGSTSSSSSDSLGGLTNQELVDYLTTMTSLISSL